MSLLEFSNVSLSLGSSGKLRGAGTEILSGVSFDVSAGSVVGVLGRNGAGKSILCRLAVGALFPSSGEVRFSGENRFLLSLNQYIHRYLTVREQVYALCAWRNVPADDWDTILGKAAAFGEFSRYLQQSMGALSSGQQARVLFSTAMEIGTDLLAIDESLSVGDLEFRQKSHKRIKEFIDGNGTCLIVTHNHNTVQALCDKAVLLEDGRVVAKGDVQAITRLYELSLVKTGTHKTPQGFQSRTAIRNLQYIVRLLAERDVLGEFYVREKYGVDGPVLRKFQSLVSEEAVRLGADHLLKQIASKTPQDL